jgi:hypothetical protein
MVREEALEARRANMQGTLSPVDLGRARIVVEGIYPASRYYKDLQEMNSRLVLRLKALEMERRYYSDLITRDRSEDLRMTNSLPSRERLRPRIKGVP